MCICICMRHTVSWHLALQQGPGTQCEAVTNWTCGYLAEIGCRPSRTTLYNTVRTSAAHTPRNRTQVAIQVAQVKPAQHTKHTVVGYMQHGLHTYTQCACDCSRLSERNRQQACRKNFGHFPKPSLCRSYRPCWYPPCCSQCAHAWCLQPANGQFGSDQENG